MGKLIVIEGTDSSGKETQTKKLYERLAEKGINVKKITFPNYESPACGKQERYCWTEKERDDITQEFGVKGVHIRCV